MSALRYAGFLLWGVTVWCDQTPRRWHFIAEGMALMMIGQFARIADELEKGRVS